MTNILSLEVQTLTSPCSIAVLSFYLALSMKMAVTTPVDLERYRVCCCIIDYGIIRGQREKQLIQLMFLSEQSGN